MKDKNKIQKIRLYIILLISIAVISTGLLMVFNSLKNGDPAAAILGGMIAVIIIGFAIFIFSRGNKDLKQGYPIKDERSVRVMERASSKAFFVTLYLLLFIGWASDSLIDFRDISQATSFTIGSMALLLAGFWIYYNKKKI